MDSHSNNSNSTITLDNSNVYRYSLTALFFLVMIIGISTNLITCYILLLRDRARTTTAIFLFNLSLADILLTVVCTPTTVISDVLLFMWPFGMVMCRLVPFIQATSVFLSAFIHVIISWDRFLVVFYPFRKRPSTKFAWTLIACVWLCAASISAPMIIVNQIVQARGNVELCQEIWPEGSHGSFVYSVVVLVFQYFLPVTVIVGTYTPIAIKLWIRKIPGVQMQSNTAMDQVNSGKKRLIKMVIVVALFYTITQLPRHVIFIMSATNPGFFYINYMIELSMLAHFFSISVTCYNFFIYMWMNNSFRDSFYKIFNSQNRRRGGPTTSTRL